MAGNPQHGREDVYALIDRLAPDQFEAVRNLLEVLVRDREEDEEISAAEESAVARSKEWFRENEGIPIEDVAAELGLSMDQIRSGSAKEPAA